MLPKQGCVISRHLPRVFLSLLFIVSGIGFATNFAGTVPMVAAGLEPLGLASLAVAVTVLVIVLKIGGGVLLAVGVQTRAAAGALALFTIAATLLYHTNWNGEGGQMQMIEFLKNLAILGGLMLYSGCWCKSCRIANGETTEA